MDDYVKNILINPNPNSRLGRIYLSDDGKKALFDKLKSLGLQTISDIYSDMAKLEKNLKEFKLDGVWAKRNFENILDPSQRLTLCGNIISEKNKELKLEELEKLKSDIINLLKEKAVKMPASDIDAFLKHQNVDKVKELCEEMYHNGEISRTANYRYFILPEEKEKPKKAASDPTVEVRKYAKLRDDGIITEEEFQAKKKELLGL
jgi:hypothetical protein